MRTPSRKSTLAALGIVVASGLAGQACGKTGSGFGDAGTGPMDAGVRMHEAGPADTWIPPLVEATPDMGPVADTSGPPVCDPSCGAAGGKCTLGKCTINENPGAVSSGTQGALMSGGSADPTYRWLYPYDQTIFPRGLIPPTFQFDGTTGADAVYIKITSATMSYSGFFAGAAPLSIQLPAASWLAITEAAGPKDYVKVDVTKIAAGAVTGPATETWRIAQGSVLGTVYYTSYTTLLADGGSGTLKIKIGDTAPSVLVGSCNNCHSVSANGSVLAASYGHVYDATYDLTGGAAKLSQVPDCVYCLPAMYPDGSFLLTNYGSMIPGMGGTTPNTLYDTKTGLTIPFTWVGGQAAMPAFSPDGKQLVYNHQDTGGGHVLATCKFDSASKTFSSPVDLLTSPSYPSWPQFTPDGASVIYHDDNSPDYATWSGNKAEMYMLDVATQKSWRLDALDGYQADGVTSYLPYTGENGYNFEPTVLPVAVGGYYWVVFTSRRYYGNLVTPTNYPDPSNNPRKKLWVAAIDIGAPPGTDASHPAFYVDGQEFLSGNMRGFWVLDPCKANGNTCATADECCNGFCRPGPHGGPKVCVSRPGGCSQEYEYCTQASDCCAPGSLCIDDHCATPTPPP